MEKLKQSVKPAESRESVESRESIEYEPSQEAVQAFLDVDAEAFESFKARLAGVEGHGRLWVHPLYTEQWPGSFRGKSDEREGVGEKLRSAFLHTVESVHKNPQSSPVLIFEASGKMQETKAIVASALGIDVSQLSHRGMFFFSTEVSSSFPDDGQLRRAMDAGNVRDREGADVIRRMEAAGRAYVDLSKKKQMERQILFPESKEGLVPLLLDTPGARRRAFARQVIADESEMRALRDERFESFEKVGSLKDAFTISLVKQLGFRSALISGAYLEGGTNSKTKEQELQACAGHVAQILRVQGMQVDISHNIWPPRERLVELGFETKQTSKKSPQKEEGGEEG